MVISKDISNSKLVSDDIAKLTREMAEIRENLSKIDLDLLTIKEQISHRKANEENIKKSIQALK